MVNYNPDKIIRRMLTSGDTAFKRKGKRTSGIRPGKAGRGGGGGGEEKKRLAD